MNDSNDLKTLKCIKRTIHITLLYFSFCFFSLFAIFILRYPMFYNKKLFEFAVVSIILWVANPMVFVVALKGLNIYLTEREDLKKRNIIGKRWMIFILCNASAVIAWIISCTCFVYFTGGV